jgi:hypothetical protein
MIRQKVGQQQQGEEVGDWWVFAVAYIHKSIILDAQIKIIH